MNSRFQDRGLMLASAGMGALVMYLFDASTGSRRRALLRNQFIKSIHRTGKAMGTTWRDARNRGYGLVADAATRWRDQPVSDDILVQRVRARLGMLVRHPSSIEVTSDNGRIVLRGPLLRAEVDRLMEAVRRVRDVREVDNQLEVHHKPEDIPGLQGDPGRAPRDSQFEFMQENWSPTARMSMGVTGAALAFYGLSRHGFAGGALALAGSALVTRASLNVPWTRITGVGAGHRAVDVVKTVRIAAPRPNVFAFWTRYTDFPKYTTHVQEVLEQGDGRSRWTVVGPAGIKVSWNAVITRLIPNEELAWRTEPDSSVQHAGILKFKDNRDATTTMHAKITYNPPAGVIGHGVARMLRADLKSLLEDDLVRIKTVLEEATIPRDVQRREAQPMLKAEQLET